MNGDDEIESGQYGRKPGNEDSHGGGDYICVDEVRAERRGERPSGIHTAAKHHIQLNAAPHDEQVPAHEVDLREGHVFRANHERYKKVAEDGWRYRHQKEKHHDDAVYGEQFVVGVRGHEIAGGRQEF